MQKEILTEKQKQQRKAGRQDTRKLCRRIDAIRMAIKRGEIRRGVYRG